MSEVKAVVLKVERDESAFVTVLIDGKPYHGKVTPVPGAAPKLSMLVAEPAPKSAPAVVPAPMSVLAEAMCALRDSDDAAQLGETTRKVLDMYIEGMSESAMAARLKFSQSTINYHVNRLKKLIKSRSVDAFAYLPPRLREVVELLEAGFTKAQIAKKLGLGRSAISSYLVRISKRRNEHAEQLRHDFTAAARTQEPVMGELVASGPLPVVIGSSR